MKTPLLLLGLLLPAAWSVSDKDRENALAFLQRASEESYNQELLDLVAIPSVSSLPEHEGDVWKAARWLEQRLVKAGLENVNILATDGPRPAVYAEYLHAPAGAPTALIYGHYDVQPAADTADLWISPPFQPEIRDGRVWGRGADDDKGSGVLPPIQAIEAMLKSSSSTPAQLPINIKFMLEGEEEIGSPFLEPFLAKHAPLLAADFVLSADGGQAGPNQPAIPLGLRGALAVEIEAVTATRDVHSGLAGGAIQNPNRALAQLLSTLWHKNNHSIAVSGWYDKVKAITEEDRADMASNKFDDQKELLSPLGASQVFGEAGYTSLERLWYRPTIELVGMGGGFQGEGIKTIVPRRAFAKLAARLVPDQSPAEILELIKAHVAAHQPPACNITIRLLGFSAHPYSQPKDSMPNRAAAKVLTELMGSPPIYVRSGATIPALAAFQKYLNASTTVFAFGLPDSAMHAPNENFWLSMYRLARTAWVELLFELGRQGAARQPADHSEL